ncbi:hypothetical protein CEXT_322761 [Caerostris extrusa]|uniref:Uncharacterized protein n=1 Tax=Caerostris extrusa TaxID=172846 RepID=A0AAV4UAX1_CAEEX|nr:hypothetical protein CEXT_322761 [Caerostris extrusa]
MSQGYLTFVESACPPKYSLSSDVSTLSNIMSYSVPVVANIQLRFQHFYISLSSRKKVCNSHCSRSSNLYQTLISVSVDVKMKFFYPFCVERFCLFEGRHAMFEQLWRHTIVLLLWCLRGYDREAVC